MDLRGYKVPANIDEILRDQTSRGLVWYQPFIFSDTAIAGTGAAWNNSIGIRNYICTDEDPENVRSVFLSENRRLGDWYGELVRMVIACSPKSEEFLDLGCNVGHFSFELTAAGKKATGVDVWGECYEFVSEITGLSFNYVNQRYDSALHQVPSLGERTFDFVIASAIQTHLSDPHFFMGYTNRIARHGLLYTTPVTSGQDPTLRLRITQGRRTRPVPERFEFLPTVAAMELILQCMRPFVYRRATQVSDPKNTAQWGTWIALSHALPEGVMNDYHLTLTIGRVNQFADVGQGSFSIPRAKLGE